MDGEVWRAKKRLQRFFNNGIIKRVNAKTNVNANLDCIESSFNWETEARNLSKLTLIKK